MPERSLLKLLPAAVCLVIFLAVLLIARSFFRRATRGETVQATVRRVEMDGSIPDIHPDVTILYVFPWQGRILERPVGPRKNILPPPIGQRQNMRYDAKSDRLREVPTGRPTSCLTLLYGVALSRLSIAGSASAYLSDSPAMAAAVILVTLGGFLFAAVFSTIRHRRNFRKRLANGSIQPVPAVFQGYVRREDAENNRVNVPVYLCFWGGRTYRMEIGMGRRPYRPGERVTLYRDVQTGHVLESPFKAGPSRRSS